MVQALILVAPVAMLAAGPRTPAEANRDAPVPSCGAAIHAVSIGIGSAERAVVPDPRAVAFVMAVVPGTGATADPQAGPAAVAVPSADSDPDALYAERASLERALAAASIWEGRLRSDPRDFDSAWKLARTCYWLGAHVPSKERRQQYERGVEAGRRAAELSPKRPEGHFWMAANMGTMAESFGLRVGLKYRSPVKRALETVLALDPAYQQGSADRALGRWYLRVPGWLGGSKQKSVEHLQRSLGHDPGSAASHFFLAETYLDMSQRDDARRELQAVLDAPLHPDWVPEVLEFKARATALLARLP